MLTKGDEIRKRHWVKVTLKRTGKAITTQAVKKDNVNLEGIASHDVSTTKQNVSDNVH